jgi:hypothetical protein
VINELADQSQEHRAGVETRLASQKESLEKFSEAATQEKSLVERHLDRLNAEVQALQTNFMELTNRQVLASEARGIGHDANSPSAYQMIDHSLESEGTLGSGEQIRECASCSCRLAPGTVNSSGSENVCRMHAAKELVTLSGVLNNSELPLPLYDDATEMNPVFHIRKLEEFMDFRKVPQQLRLAIACRSMVEQIGRQWVEGISPQLRDYEAFKKAFLNTWWSTSRQSLVRCNIYQAKYDRRSNLSLSAHFLKYATMASYLDPKPSDPDMIEAIKSHFPIAVQRAMLTNQLRTVEETLDLLKRIEIMEASEGFQRPTTIPSPECSKAGE